MRMMECLKDVVVWKPTPELLEDLKQRGKMWEYGMLKCKEKYPLYHWTDEYCGMDGTSNYLGTWRYDPSGQIIVCAWWLAHEGDPDFKYPEWMDDDKVEDITTYREGEMSILYEEFEGAFPVEVGTM